MREGKKYLVSRIEIKLMEKNISVDYLAAECDAGAPETFYRIDYWIILVPHFDVGLHFSSLCECLACR